MDDADYRIKVRTRESSNIPAILYALKHSLPPIILIQTSVSRLEGPFDSFSLLSSLPE